MINDHKKPETVTISTGTIHAMRAVVPDVPVDSLKVSGPFGTISTVSEADYKNLHDAYAKAMNEARPTPLLAGVLQTRAGRRDVEHEERWVGDDDVDHRIVIPVNADEAELGFPTQVGVLVHLTKDADGANRLGYSIVRQAELGAKPEPDDIHVSLAELCDDHGLDFDEIVDRMAVALLRATGARS
jgi:hypothetical protein